MLAELAECATAGTLVGEFEGASTAAEDFLKEV